MYIHEEWGTIFDIGDFVKSKYRKNIIGLVIEVILPKKDEPGYYKIRNINGIEYFDYHYVFELDIEKEREKKLNNLLND
jgi:hypothetical protein